MCGSVHPKFFSESGKRFFLKQKHTLYEAIAEAEEPMAGMWLSRLIWGHVNNAGPYDDMYVTYIELAIMNWKIR